MIDMNGVNYLKKQKRYNAYTTFGGKRLHFGCFGSAEEASKAHDDGIFRLRLDFRKMNHPEKYSEQTELRCPVCDNIKPLDDFMRTVRGWGLIPSKVERNKRCSACRVKTKKSIYLSQTAQAQIDYKNRGEKQFLRMRLSLIKQRAKKKSLVFEIGIDDAFAVLKKQDYECVFCGRKMKFIAGQGHYPEVMSVDRIDRNRGYEKGNVQFACAVCNRAKGVLDDGSFIELCKMIVNKRQNGG
jgi:5-methylcytosine-specific restriction endonuclease McrA